MNDSTFFVNWHHANRFDLTFPINTSGEFSVGTAAPENCVISTLTNNDAHGKLLNPDQVSDLNHTSSSIAQAVTATQSRSGDGADENPPAAAAVKPTPAPSSPLATSTVAVSIEENEAEVLAPESLILYPTSLTPDDTYRVLRRELPEPLVDRQFILSASIGSMADGINRVADHHAALFLTVHGLKVRALNDQEQARTQRVISRKSEAADLTRKLKKTDRYHDSVTPEGSTPWNLHDRLEVTALVGCSLLCLFIGVANITNLLQSSGEVAFNNVWKALPFGLGVVIGAIAFKAFARLFSEGPQRRAYGFGLFGIGLVAFLGWLGGFSAIFSGALTPVGELLANYANSSAASDPANRSGIHASTWMMFAGCLADAALSAGAWIVAQMICRAHQTPRRAESQAWTRVRTDLNRVLKKLHEEEALLGLVRGALESERAQQAVFVNKAVAFHNAAAASQRQTREALALE